VPDATGRAAREEVHPRCLHLHDTAERLKQRSRFLCRQSDRLRGRANDLLTVALFYRRRAARPVQAPRARLGLVS
jgi:hypothetical protein